MIFIVSLTPSGLPLSDTADFWSKMSTVIKKELKDYTEALKKDIKKEIVDPLEIRIELLENKLRQKEEKIDLLSTVIINQQKALAYTDSAERGKNIIISGIPEAELESGSNKYENDVDKIKAVFETIEIADSDTYKFSYKRLGEAKPNYNRVLKVTFDSKKIRDAVILKSKDLKDKGIPWKSIYVKKDVHIVQQKENERMRKKKKYLSELEINKDKEVKIQDGKLYVDNRLIDENMFFY